MTLPIIIAAIVLNLLLLISLLIILPRLLQRHDTRTSSESERLREMLLDVLSEQEAVTMRQNQIGVSLAHMNHELAGISKVPPLSAEAVADAAGFPQLERHIQALQGQLGVWFELGLAQQDVSNTVNRESWGNLLSLIATMQDRIAELNTRIEEQTQPSQNSSDHLLSELEQEMQQLHGIAADIAALQNRLRSSMPDRETPVAARSAVRRPSALTNRAA